MLYGMLGGDHEALPTRRRTVPSIAFDGTAGTFVAEDGGPVEPSTWLGRGELPGQPLAVSVSNEGLSVADEMRRLAAARATDG